MSSKGSNSSVPSSSISSMMGGVVGVDSTWKLFNEDSNSVEEGVVIFVTYQTGLVVIFQIFVHVQFTGYASGNDPLLFSSGKAHSKFGGVCTTS